VTDLIVEEMTHKKLCYFLDEKFLKIMLFSEEIMPVYQEERGDGSRCRA
jgi:hypothetical protein